VVSALGVRSRKLSNALNGQSWDGWPKPYHLELLRASEGTLSRWSRLHLQSLPPTNPHWARVVGYGPFPLWLIHKEGLCPSSGNINRLMMKYIYLLQGRITTVYMETILLYWGIKYLVAPMKFILLLVIRVSSSSYPYPTKWGRYNMFSSRCDKDPTFIFTTGRLPDVNPWIWSGC
jgi:hypothetical protein